MEILLVGMQYEGETIENANISTYGLSRPELLEEYAAYTLSEYDIIIINTESYSHFIFGKSTQYSKSENELWDLKAKDNNYDLDNAFNHSIREHELLSAIKQGTRVIWLVNPDKKIKFFGTRTLYCGFCCQVVEDIMQNSIVYHKKSKRIYYTHIGKKGQFFPYFKQLEIDGWRTCFHNDKDSIECLAYTADSDYLGAEVRIYNSTGWILTNPTTQEAVNKLVLCSMGLGQNDVILEKYHGIFLSHTYADKDFVRQLKESLNNSGVKDVWLDEAEINIGDSLSKKISEGLRKTKYIAVVLSPESIKSNWVEKELDIAINREIESEEVVVLPILYKECELPSFLAGKMYADFTTKKNYESSLKKLLRRLRR